MFDCSGKLVLNFKMGALSLKLEEGISITISQDTATALEEQKFMILFIILL